MHFDGTPLTGVNGSKEGKEPGHTSLAPKRDYTRNDSVMGLMGMFRQSFDKRAVPTAPNSNLREGEHFNGS
jgi:hypothetical protein